VAFLDRLGEGNEVLRAETVGLGGQGHDDPASVAGVPVPLDEFVVLEAVHQGSDGTGGQAQLGAERVDGHPVAGEPAVRLTGLRARHHTASLMPLAAAFRWSRTAVGEVDDHEAASLRRIVDSPAGWRSHRRSPPLRDPDGDRGGTAELAPAHSPPW
jgi:hypothetical protein